MPAASTDCAASRLLQSARQWPGSLRYQPEAGRDPRLDLLRGFAVFAMVVDHLGGFSPLQSITGGNRWFTSAAEAFVFISGFLVGMVYHRFATRDGLGPSLRRLFERALQLYVLAVGLTLIILPASELLDLPWAQGLDLRNPLEVVTSIVTLHRTYYLVDVLLLYSLLLLLAAPALVLLDGGRTWVVVGLSWLVWAGHQVFPNQFDVTWPIAGNYLFFFSSWQVLFFTPMALGYHRGRVSAAVSRAWRLPLLLISGLGFLGLVLLYNVWEPALRVIQTTQGPIEGGASVAFDVFALLFSKGDVRIGRLVASTIVFGFLYLLTTELWVPLRRGLGWLLLPLGQNALYAYSAHVLIAVVIGILTVYSSVRVAGSPSANTVVQVLSVALILFAIRSRLLHPSRAHLHWWMSSPVVLAFVALAVLRADPTPDLPGLAAAPPSAAAAPARAARVFGTPVTRRMVEEANRLVMTPVPLPPPAPDLVAEQPAPGVEPVVSEFVGSVRGTFREVQFYSAALDHDMPYFIYLPPGNAKEGRRYPVLYMLHGGSGDKGEWPAYDLVGAVDSLIDSKDLRPLILVMPQGDFGYWLNHINDGPRWGDYVALDLVRHIDASYRTLPDPEHRAVGGNSMGGHGALQLSFNHPDVFRAAGAHSPSLYPEGGMLTSIAGKGDDFAARDPISLAQSAPGIENLNIWIDIGEEDPWRERAEQLHQTLDERGISHLWGIRSGGHEGAYWQRNLLAYLRFYDRFLNWRDSR